MIEGISSAPPSPTAIGDGKVTTLAAIFTTATKHFTQLSSRCERSSSNYKVKLPVARTKLLCEAESAHKRLGSAMGQLERKLDL